MIKISHRNSTKKSNQLDNFIAVGENISSMRSDDSGLENRDENHLRLFGAFSFQWLSGHFIDVKYSQLNDYSGINVSANSSTHSQCEYQPLIINA